MIQIYTKQLEQIIAAMGKSIGTGEADITNAEYNAWLEFLKQIYPTSELLVQPVLATAAVATTIPVNKVDIVHCLKEYNDIREIMMLAEVKGYPTWFVQPHYVGLTVFLEYSQGKLSNISFEDQEHIEHLELQSLDTIPITIPEYSGTVIGVLHMSSEDYKKYGVLDSETAQVAVYQAYLNHDIVTLKFVAISMDGTSNFIEQMEILEKYGFVTAEYVLFPTNRLSTISSSKLETFFTSYIAKARDSGIQTDGLLISSDTAITKENNHSKQLLYKSSLDST